MDKEKIKKWYLKDNLSQRQIAKKLGYSQFKVKYLMKRYRMLAESQRLKNRKQVLKHMYLDLLIKNI